MNDRLRGKLSIVAAAFFYSSGTILTKWLSKTYDPVFLTLTDFAVGIVFILSWFLIRRRKVVIRDWKWLIVRGVLGAAATITFFVALSIGDSGRTTLLNMTYPLFAAVYGFLFFREKLSVFHFVSLALCFAGVMFVFYDGSKLSAIGDLLALLSGALGGITVHFIKKSRTNNEAVTVYLALCVFGFLASLPKACWIAKVTPAVGLILLGKGLIYLIAQTVSTYGYRFITATTASIIAYINIPLTLALSLWIAREKMNGKFVIGAVLLVTGLVVATLTRGDRDAEEVPEAKKE